jgi:hypothetical protein
LKFLHEPAARMIGTSNPKTTLDGLSLAAIWTAP